MHIYDYRCTICNTTYDVFHKGREVMEDIICPSCGSSNHKKLMSIPVLSMKPSSSTSNFANCPSCDTSGCCGGACEMN